MKQIIAIPLENGVLCPHFGHCQEFAIVEVENKTIVNIKTISPPEHAPGLYPRWVAGFGVTDVIGGGMGQRAIDLFKQQNINAFVGAPVKTAQELVNDLIENKLELNVTHCNHHEGHECGH